MIALVQVLTKALTAALMNAAGDLFAQLFFEKNSIVDWKRVATFAFLVRSRPITYLSDEVKCKLFCHCSNAEVIVDPVL